MLLCGHALVGAELLRGTIAMKGDHERTLQTAQCGNYPACMALGAIEVQDCCPTIYNQMLDCCGAPAPSPTEDTRTDEPGPSSTIPLPPTTTTATPAPQASCEVEACLRLGATATQQCCPTITGDMWQCCGVQPGPAPTDTAPTDTAPTDDRTETVKSTKCVDNLGCKNLGAYDGDCCPPPGTNTNMICCGW
jgi:hypothetical protein